MQFDPTLYVITDSTYHTTETLLHAVDEARRGRRAMSPFMPSTF